MIRLVLTFIVIMIFVLWPLQKLLKKGSRKEISLFIGLSIVGFLLHAGLALQVRFPNPSDGIIMLFKPFRDWVYQFLA